MSANSFGQIFRVTTFGESHGAGMGAVVEGCPSEIPFDQELLQRNMDRRRPGQSAVTTSRMETDRVRVLSGVFEGKTLGTPIAMTIENENAISSNYSRENLNLRPGHATDLWEEKFGHSDPRGSGRASGRETACRVMAGSVAQMVLRGLAPELSVCAYVSQIGPIRLEESLDLKSYQVDVFETRMPRTDLNERAKELLLQAKNDGDSYGGLINLMITGCPKGLGQPVFHKIKADLASAFMGVGACTSVQMGSSKMDLSQNGKTFHSSNQLYGGVRGGLTTGEVVQFQLGFKPPATLDRMAKEGRHDPCILPRAVPVIEAMAQLVLVDHLLWKRLDRAK